MPRPQPPPGTAHWTISGVLGTTHWSIGWWLLTHVDVIPDDATLRTVHGELLLWWNDLISGVCPTETTSSVSRFRVYSVADERTDTQFILAHGGRGPSAPAIVCSLAVWHVQARGKGRSGRTFFPGVAHFDCQLQSLLSDQAQPHFQSKVVEFWQGVNSTSLGGAANLQLGVLHQRENGAYLDNALVAPVDRVLVSPRLSHQDGRSTPRNLSV